MFFRISLMFLLLHVMTGCAEPPYNNLDNSQLKTMIVQGVPIFDIRRAEEWKQTGIIESSQLLTFVDAGGRVRPDFLSRFTQAVGKDEAVILICRTGNRSGTLARHLIEQMGYTNVHNVHDGISRWISDGHAVTRKLF